jgi:FkbM family methyltransferase
MIKSDLLREVILGVWRMCRHADTTSLRLAWRALRSARRRAGVFRFSFGRLRYLDAESLYYQYDEIIRCRGYDFESRETEPVILDCGGNIGLSVIRFKSLYPGARITVFEADPAVAKVLAENLDAAGVGGVNIRRAAAWIRNGTVRFEADGMDGGHLADAPAPGESVPCVGLAEIITEPLDLLKLDIEGSEFAVIADLAAADRIRFVRRLACEVHCSSERSAQLAQMLSQLNEAGFAVSLGHVRAAPDLPGKPEPTPFPRLSDGRHLIHLYAWRRSGEDQPGSA